jgi:nicotinamide-nucleotide amidase
MSDEPRRTERLAVDDQDVAADIALRLGRLTLATAESCTAGRVAESFATVERATEFLRGGLVAYQESVKRNLLDVRADAMVSPGAAAQMAAGAAKLFDADVTVATTGLAGPDPEGGVPGGTVFIATCVQGLIGVREHHFDGSPETVCDQAKRQALLDLRERFAS